MNDDNDKGQGSTRARRILLATTQTTMMQQPPPYFTVDPIPTVSSTEEEREAFEQVTKLQITVGGYNIPVDLEETIYRYKHVWTPEQIELVVRDVRQGADRYALSMLRLHDNLLLYDLLDVLRVEQHVANVQKYRRIIQVLFDRLRPLLLTRCPATRIANHGLSLFTYHMVLGFALRDRTDDASRFLYTNAKNNYDMYRKYQYGNRQKLKCLTHVALYLMTRWCVLNNYDPSEVSLVLVTAIPVHYFDSFTQEEREYIELVLNNINPQRIKLFPAAAAGVDTVDNNNENDDISSIQAAATASVDVDNNVSSSSSSSSNSTTTVDDTTDTTTAVSSSSFVDTAVDAASSFATAFAKLNLMNTAV